MSSTESDKEARNAEKEVKAVSKLVSRKLEGYINYARREQRFDPSGRGYRTTPSMEKYDVMYKMLELTEMEAAHRKKAKAAEKEENKEKKLAISPRLETTSRRVTLNHEAERITKNANTVFESTPVEKLSIIHRYRPHSGNIQHSTDNGKVMNYTRHIGAALHSETYLQYYQKEGLETGSKKKSPRLQKLKPKPKDTDKKSPRESELGDANDKDEETKADERYAPKKAAHYMVQNGKPISLDDRDEDKDKRTKKWVKERQTNDKGSKQNETNIIKNENDNKDHETHDEKLDSASVASEQSVESNTSRKSNQSNKSSNSHYSNRSKSSNHSNRSKSSTHSNKSHHSNRSKVSNHSDKRKNSQCSVESKDSIHSTKSNKYNGDLADEDNSTEDKNIKSTDEKKQMNNTISENNRNELTDDSEKDKDSDTKDENHNHEVQTGSKDSEIDDNGKSEGDNLHHSSIDDTVEHNNPDDDNVDDCKKEENTTEHDDLGDNKANDKEVKKQCSEDTHSTNSEIYSSVEHIDRRANMFI